MSDSVHGQGASHVQNRHDRDWKETVLACGGFEQSNNKTNYLTLAQMEAVFVDM
jgi:hypothetical protein